MNAKRFSIVALAAVIATVTACGPRHNTADGDVGPRATDTVASAVMRSSTGETLGTLSLHLAADGRLRLTGALTGIPAGTHGIHLHAVGRCEGPGFESAGGHFNPAGRAHGLENAAGPHAGDAPNISADASSRTAVHLLLAGASLDPGSAGYINDGDGVAIVVHAAADDQRTDPSGNSGARIACGVVARS